jgi:hypothetical protein
MIARPADDTGAVILNEGQIFNVCSILYLAPSKRRRLERTDGKVNQGQ